MADDLTVQYGYRMEGHDTLDRVDASFYRQLPNASEEFRDSNTGREVVPAPDPVTLITVIGSAVLSSSGLAAVIKTWLQNKRRRIVITIGATGDKIEYEGPDLAVDAAEIEAMIERRRAAAGSGVVQIQAQFLFDD